MFAVAQAHGEAMFWIFLTIGGLCLLGGLLYMVIQYWQERKK